MASTIPPSETNARIISLPPIPQWYMVEDQIPQQPEEVQLSFLTKTLESEIDAHNKARALLHKYLALFMKYERVHFADRKHIRYLNRVIQDLRTQLQDHRMNVGRLEMTRPGIIDDFDLPLPGVTFPEYFVQGKPTSAIRDSSSCVHLSDVENNMVETPLFQSTELKASEVEELARSSAVEDDDYHLHRLASWAVFESNMQMDTQPQSMAPEWFALDEEDRIGEVNDLIGNSLDSRDDIWRDDEVTKGCKKRKLSLGVEDGDQQSLSKRRKY